VFRVALRLLLAAALGAVPSLARADVYRWVDDSGATHYATALEAVPRRYRGAAEVIKPPPSTIGNPSGARPPEPAPRPAAAPAPAAAEPKPIATEPTPAPVAPPSAASPSLAPGTPPPAELAPTPTPPDSHSSESIAPPPSHGRAAEDPRAEEIAQLEGQIERDREVLRQLISASRWDSAELAADPRVREIAERMPRLQAELAALRSEAGH
jgi:hypothetical protein